MSAQTIQYIFNVAGNANSVVQDISQNVETMNSKITNSVSVFASFEGKLAVFNQVSQFAERFSQSLSSALQPGAALNASLADLSAISGETGKGLKLIEQYARESALTFGGSAAASVESYKLLLSQLSPELAKTPSALKAMGDNIAILSKTMGGDSKSAAEVLTTAMNQYGVSLSNPTAAAAEMTRMMNIMAAAGKEGSAELPAIKAALEQCGMAAKGANVAFSETNAAIQVLDKAGKKGAEGGVALRNALAILSTGRFLPKDVRDELQAAGVDINTLGDKSLTLTDRLKPLKKVMNDSALFTKLFGRENVNAAMALVNGTSEIDRYTKAIEGTNTAQEQAGIIMETYNEKLARVQARFDNFKISIFNASGDFGIWTQVIASSLVPLAQLVPLIWGVTKAVHAAKLGFAGFKLSAVTACKAVGVAIKSIPIIGWVIAAIAAIGALFAYFYKTSDKFRATVNGIGAAIKALFTGNNIKDAYHNAYVETMDEAARDRAERADEEEAEKAGMSVEDYVKTRKGVSPVGTSATPSPYAANPIAGAIGGVGSDTGSGRVKSVTISINNMIEKFEINTTNMKESTAQVKNVVLEALMSAINDVNLTTT